MNNRYGLILDGEVNGAVPALDGLLHDLLEQYLKPMAASFFPDMIKHHDVLEHFAFVIRYQQGEDVSLAEHRDASVATLNLNLNLPSEPYHGSSLYFIDPEDGVTRHYVKFENGQALLHRGSVRHAALPLEGGTRQNLVIWLFGKGGEVRAETAPYTRDEWLTPAERWSVNFSQIDGKEEGGGSVVGTGTGTRTTT